MMKISATGVFAFLCHLFTFPHVTPIYTFIFTIFITFSTKIWAFIFFLLNNKKNKYCNYNTLKYFSSITIPNYITFDTFDNIKFKKCLNFCEESNKYCKNKLRTLEMETFWKSSCSLYFRINYDWRVGEITIMATVGLFFFVKKETKFSIW